MSTHFNLTEIEQMYRQGLRTLLETANSIDEARFYENPGGKWSAAEHLLHLLASARATTLAYRLPAWAIRLYTGRPNRPGRSYEELVARYQAKLAAGGAATGRFVPRRPEGRDDKLALINRFEQEAEKLIILMGRGPEKKMDRCLAPHPLLGKITLRELAYFTCYHHEHHRLLLIRDYPGLTGSFTAS